MTESYLFWGFGLLGAALILFVIEIFLPSGGVIAILSATAAIASVVAFWMESWVWGISSLGVVIVLTPVCFNFAIKVMPHTPFGKLLILGAEEEDAGQRAAVDAERHQQEQSLIGAEGRTLTDLRPVGTAEIEGTRVDALSESGVIPAGTRVKVVRVEGTQITVRAV